MLMVFTQGDAVRQSNKIMELAGLGSISPGTGATGVRVLLWAVGRHTNGQQFTDRQNALIQRQRPNLETCAKSMLSRSVSKRSINPHLSLFL